MQSLTPLLPRDARVEVHNCLAIVQARVSSLAASSDGKSPPAVQAGTATLQPVQNRRYLGEISDVHFCKIVRQTADSDGESGDAADDVDDYDLEEQATPRHLAHPLTEMPGRAEVEEDLHTYFSTIHFAYPFVSKASFMTKVETLQTEGVTTGLTPSWLSLLCEHAPQPVIRHAPALSCVANPHRRATGHRSLLQFVPGQVPAGGGVAPEAVPAVSQLVRE